MDIREMIAALRRVGLSLEAIAFGVQVHKSTISRIVSGKIRVPRLSLVGKVERLFREFCI